MMLHKNKFLTTVAAAALALAVGACSSSSDDDETLSVAPAPVAGGGTGGGTGGSGPAAPTLESVQVDAATAAIDAQTAATAAQTAADAAELARANRAAIQTGDFHAGNSGELADKAQEHADAAQLAANAAKTASDAAAAATDMVAATRALVMAETSKMAAGNQQTYAEMAQASAMTAAASEIKIVEKTKTVGDTSITIGEVSYEATINAVTTKTGLLKDVKLQDTGMTAGIENDDDTADVDESRPGAAVRNIDIGVVYDSDDDTARLALVTAYVGSETVSAFVRSNQERSGSKAGVIDHDAQDTTAELPLKAAPGSYYRADGLTDEGMIATAEKATALHYYEMADGMKVYVESTGTSEVTGSMGVFQHNYQEVTVEDGVKLPDASGYKHLHFGVWAGLEAADETTGDNAIGDLGLGFVAGLSEMTGDDMPNFGTGMYTKGNWVANVQVEDDDGDGAIMLQDGDASMIADFEEGTVAVTLTDLANLEGTIDGNSFSGAKAALFDMDPETDAIENDSGLGLAGKFTGNLSGAFFGPQAVEAGGVFDFASEDNKEGAFRGAFGVAR